MGQRRYRTSHYKTFWTLEKISGFFLSCHINFIQILVSERLWLEWNHNYSTPFKFTIPTQILIHVHCCQFNVFSTFSTLITISFFFLFRMKILHEMKSWHFLLVMWMLSIPYTEELNLRLMINRYFIQVLIFKFRELR